MLHIECLPLGIKKGFRCPVGDTRKGDEVEVHYDPQVPHKAVMNVKQSKQISRGLFVAGCLVVVMAIVLHSYS